MVEIAPLPSALDPFLKAEWPYFSDVEMARRFRVTEELMAAAAVDHLLVYGFGWNGTGIPWLTHWPTTSEAALVVTPGVRNALFVQFYNHVPQAERVATGCDVEWGGEDTLASVVETLRTRGATAGQRVGVIGPLTIGAHAKLAAAFPNTVDLNRAFARARLVKSPEEIEWMRIGAWMSDLAMKAVHDNLRPGVTERDLGDLCESAWVPHGGETVIHFFGSTAMDAPDCRVPRQYPSVRPIAAGDVVFCEISGAFRGYSGQVLRTFTVGAEPTPLYRDLHDAAAAAFEAISNVLRAGAHPSEIVAASAVIEEAGFTTCDDLMHGYGGGYLPPIVGSASRPAGEIPDLPLAVGMLVVVQPNVVTRDGSAGVQTGECLLITETGCEPVHCYPRGLFRV